MLFSIRTERALRALGRLAAIAKPGERVYLEDILDGTDAPRAFLSKVFSRLSRRGIVTSLRGRAGGYMLARPAERITLREIVEAIDGSGRAGRLTFDAPAQPVVEGNTAPSALLESSGARVHAGRSPNGWESRWQPVHAAIRDLLERTTLADLRDEVVLCGSNRPQVAQIEADSRAARA